MIPDRDYFLSKVEVERRRELADAERMIREARRGAQAQYETTEQRDERPRGAFAWLRRLAGAR